VYAIAGLTKATSTLTTRRPSLDETYRLIERVDGLLRALEVLTLPEEVEAAPVTAATIAAEVTGHGRAMAAITSGWRSCVPDLATLSGARRLSTALCRSIAALEVIERQHDTEETPDEQS
jgi:hypothetical protein